MGTEIGPTAVRVRQNRSMLSLFSQRSTADPHMVQDTSMEPYAIYTCERPEEERRRESRETGKPLTWPSDETCASRKRH